MFAGVLTTGLGFRSIATFFSSTPRGAFLLPDALHISYGSAVALVVALALVAFAVAELLERRPHSASDA
jgi:hypothetical protein